jgi:hypothetical protein
MKNQSKIEEEIILRAEQVARLWFSLMIKGTTKEEPSITRLHLYDALDYACEYMKGRSKMYPFPPRLCEYVRGLGDQEIQGGLYRKLSQKLDQLASGFCIPMFTISKEFKVKNLLTSNLKLIKMFKKILDNIDQYYLISENLPDNETSLKRFLNKYNANQIPIILALARQSNYNIQALRSLLTKLIKDSEYWAGKARLFPTTVEASHPGPFATIFLNFPSIELFASILGASSVEAEIILKDFNKYLQVHYSNVVGWIKFFKHPERDAWIVKEIQSDIVQSIRKFNRGEILKQTDLYTGESYTLWEIPRLDWYHKYKSKLDNMFKDYRRILIELLCQLASENGIKEVWIFSGQSIYKIYKRFSPPELIAKFEHFYDDTVYKINKNCSCGHFLGLECLILNVDQN